MGKYKFILIQFILVLNVFVNSGNKASVAFSRCLNPNGRLGRCVSIYKCTTILNILKAEQSSAYGFVRKSECFLNGQVIRPFVCCTRDTGFSTRNAYEGRIIFPDEFDENAHRQKNLTTTTTRTPKSLGASLLPEPPDCGQMFSVFKILGGEEAELGEFPWLANLEYKQRNGDIVSVCAGNILNQRYILTAAHCVKGEIEEKVGQLVSVRVGVHNTEASADCNDNACLEPPQRLNVAKAIVHEEYNSYDGFHSHNDIALLRTDRNMQYSMSVFPVCLPNIFPQISKLKNGEKLSVAGWGHTGAKKHSAVKLKVELPYVENENCRMKVSPKQLCAGGEFYKDSCVGDSGGGLVRSFTNIWIVEGIVSYGRGCGLERPGVYTRVSSYISWIYANVEP